MKRVSVIIVNYNTQKVTSECIDSIFENTSGIDFEVILVDNASTDGSKEFFQKDSRINYIYNDENIGFGRANNVGVKIAKGDNILFLNSDTLLKNNAMKILSDYLDLNPNVGICGGNLINKNGNPSYSFSRYYPSIYEELNSLFFNILDKIRYGKNLNYNNTGHPMNVASISGADLMVKKHLIKDGNAFNEKFFMYYEDTELCFRIKKSGYLVHSVPEAKIIHLWGSSKGSNLISARMERSRNIFYSISYSSGYTKSANAIRKAKILLKKASPFRQTRQRWREMEYTIHDVNNIQ